MGRNPVFEILEALSSGKPLPAGPRAVDRLLLSRSLPGQTAGHLRRLAREAEVPVQDVPQEALDRVATQARHQGVALKLAQRRAQSLDEVLEEAPADAFFVMLDGVEDPRNLGALVRSAAGAGASGVFFPQRRSAGLTSGAAKAAAGALERIPVARVPSTAHVLREMALRGIRTVGLDSDGPPAWGADLTGPLCLVVGGEDRGLARLTRERCDQLVSFPLARGVESLNASVAGALALYECVRQRDSGSSGSS